MKNNDNSLEKAISLILDDYDKTFHYELPNISTIITEDMTEKYFELRPDHENKTSKSLNDLNGTLVPPANYDDIFTILIDKDYLLQDIKNEKYAWAGTIAHEATHARDFIEYSKLISANDYNEILNTERHYLFHIWTEFNARRHGYYLMRKYTFENMTDLSQLSFIFETEIPYQINHMVETYSNSDTFEEQIYPVVHFIGRISVLKDLFPEYFERDTIEKLFGSNEWIKLLFEFLHSHKKLEFAINDFEDMRNVLKMNYPYL